MRNREFEGRDLDEAIREAAAALGVPDVDLHYEIVEQGRKGILGLGAKSVRIVVKPPVHELTHEQLLDPAADAELVASARVAPSPEPPVAAPSPEQEQVERTLKRIVDLAGLELEVDSSSAGGEVALSLEGPDQRLLTQKNAELLHALQFLLNRMARRAWPGVGRVRLSAVGDREDRDDQLVRRAREIARQVTETGKPRRTRPMNAYERRLVHLTVREIGGLASRSEGDGALKRVRIQKARS